MPDFNEIVLKIQSIDHNTGQDKRAALLAQACKLPADLGILSALLGAADRPLIQSYMKHPKIASDIARKANAKPRSATLDRAILNAFNERRLETIEDLLHAGVRMKHLTNHMIEAMFEASRPGIFTWIITGPNEGEISQTALMDAVQSCGTKIDAILAPEIKAMFEQAITTSFFNMSLLHVFFFNDFWKLFTLSIRLLPDQSTIDKFVQDMTEKHAPSEKRKMWLDLAHKTQSSHGRMEIMAREPDILAMVERPENAAFFGHAHSS